MSRRTGCCRVRLQSPSPLDVGFQVCETGRDVGQPAALSPLVIEAPHGTLELGVRRLAPRPVFGSPLLHLSSREDQASGALGVRGGEKKTEWSSFRLTQDKRSFGANRVHDRAYVVHSLLERGRSNTVRQTHPTLVEPDQPRELAKLATEPLERRELPHDLQM